MAEKEDKPVVQHLSVTQLQSYLRCPKAYEFRYVDKVIIPAPGVSAMGTAYHKTVANVLYFVRDNTPYTRSFVADMFDANWNAVLKERLAIGEEDGEISPVEDFYWGDEPPGKLKDQGYRCTLAYAFKFAPSVNPVEIEAGKEAQLEGIKFLYVCDVIEPLTIRDHKIKSRVFSEIDLQNSLQAAFYSLFENKQLVYDVALREKAEIKPQPANPLFTADFLTTVAKRVWQGIQSGVFPPNPNGWWCSEKWCGYWRICRGRGSS